MKGVNMLVNEISGWVWGAVGFVLVAIFVVEIGG